MAYIYLIGTSGAARTSNEDMACALEQVGGYHRCTEKEYRQRMREIRALDVPGTPSRSDDGRTKKTDLHGKPK